MSVESYCDYFKLREKPFSLAADPRFLYMSCQHWEAIAHLMYGVEDDWGFVLVTGEIGTGKTTLCRFLLNQMPGDVEVAFIANPMVDAQELLVSICDEFRVVYPPDKQSVKDLFDLISAHLMEVHAEGRKTLLIVDEAQCLSTEVLELLRLLTNLETEACKLFRIILIGQPELRDKLAGPELQQMSQRITARYHLTPLSKKDVASYISHRMLIAGAEGEPFTKAALRTLYRASGGVPRLINAIADRALLGACMKGNPLVTRSTLNQAADEVLREARFKRSFRRNAPLRWAAPVLLIGVLGAVLALSFAGRQWPAKAGQSGVTDKAGIGQQRPGLELFSGQPAAESRNGAYRALLAQRGISYYSSSSGDAPEDDSFCINMEILDLRCQNQKDPGKRAEALPVPSVLTLKDAGGKVFYAAVLSIKGDRATLKTGEVETEVATQELRQLWSGDYMTLEQLEHANKTKVAAGSRKKPGPGKRNSGSGL